MKKIFILDTMALVYRAYFAMIKSPIFTSYGLNTSAIYGFINTILKLINNHNPTHIVAAIDSFEKNIREETLFNYKANRDRQPEDITSAMQYIENILEYLNINFIKYPGYEADDIIGTLSKKLSKDKNLHIYIVSMDKDFGQLLVSDKIFIYKPSTNFYSQDVILTYKDILKKWGIKNVDQVRDILGLQGDASDNIPGVPSIGPNIASKLLKEFESIENVLKNIHLLKGNVKKNLEEYAGQALISKKLATIFTDLELEYNLEDFEIKEPNLNLLIPLLEKLEFKSLVKKFEESDDKNKKNTKELKNYSKNIKIISITDSNLEYFTDFLFKKSELLEIFCIVQNENIYFYIENEEIYYVNKKNCSKFILEILKSELLGKKKINLITFDAKKLFAFFFEDKREIKNENLKDIQILSHIINPEYGSTIENILKMNNINLPTEEEFYLALIFFSDIYKNLISEIKKKKLQHLLDIEMKLCKIFFEIEKEGVHIDKKTLITLKNFFLKEIDNVTDAIYNLAEEKFSIASPKQLGIILFEKLNILEKPKKTKSGQYATNEEVLLELKNKHEIIKHIIYFRELKKLNSTYVEGVEKLLDENNFLHTTYNQFTAVTGRIISSNPNLQNIPIKTSLGKKIRTMFTSRHQNGFIFSADYSQIELRIIAKLSGDETMMNSFLNNRDVHKETASKIFKVKIEDVTESMRRQAKSVNFGIIYGISPFGLSKQLNIKKKEAEHIINSYFTEFPAIKNFMNMQIAKAKKQGYASTVLGRRHYLRDISSRNNVIRMHAERNAINTPIQGTAAEIIKLATIDVYNFLKKKKLNSKIIMQIHDELVLDVPSEEILEIKNEIPTIMEKVNIVEIPLKVNAGYGENWLNLG